MSETTPSFLQRHPGWVLATAIILLWLVGCAVYFGSGGKIWFPPSGVYSHWEGDQIRCFVVANNEEADRLIGAKGQLICDDVTFEFEINGDVSKGVPEWGEHGVVVCGRMRLALRPHVGWPGRVTRLETKREQIFQLVDDVLKKQAPDVAYEWAPSCKMMIDDSYDNYENR